MTGMAAGNRPGGTLQAALASASASYLQAKVTPHHPIVCPDQLAFHPDGRLTCTHAEVPPGDERTRFCVDHSVALLIVELGRTWPHR